MKNSDMPAMPISEEDTDRVGDGVNIYTGLTKREYFCLHAGVADTGDEELDQIIRKGKQANITALAMAALCSRPHTSYGDTNPNAVKAADDLIRLMERTK